MRLIKMLGLAAVAAMVATAFIGATSASASLLALVLCEKNELTCEHPFPETTTIVGHATNPKLLSSLGTVECEKSLAELTLLNKLVAITKEEEEAGKKPLQLAHLLSLGFEGNCHLGSTACTVTVNKVGLISVTKIGELEASAVSTGGTEATVKCGSFINCSYAGEPLLKVKSSSEGVTSMEANKTVLKGGGFLCPSTSEWDATYTGEVDLKVVKEGKEELVSDPATWIES